ASFVDNVTENCQFQVNDFVYDPVHDYVAYVDKIQDEDVDILDEKSEVDDDFVIQDDVFHTEDYTFGNNDRVKAVQIQVCAESVRMQVGAERC
ncbi:unnamed protein product, partial [Cochlearia groenlandica]